MDDPRATVINIVEAVEPADDLEAEHRATVLTWLGSGAPMYRTEPPDVPPMHLVSYFVPYDARRTTVLIAAHRKSGLDLPPGGHVEPGESPWLAVERECVEELGIAAEPVVGIGRAPLFVTVTQTLGGPGRHTDVSLWHVIAADAADPALRPDPREFAAVRWLGLDAVLAEPIEGLDPHMHRFVRKLGQVLGRDRPGAR